MKKFEDASVTIDFLAKGEVADEWLVVLVEQWDTKSQDCGHYLYALQDRLYNCLDVIIDGKLAEKHPETCGYSMTIRVDCYNVPQEEVQDFFSRFSEGALAHPDYKKAIANSEFLSELKLEITFDTTD